MKLRTLVAGAATALGAISVGVQAHSGPPFPIVSEQVAGPYLVSVWTDPDTTDDGSPGGQFWVRLYEQGTRASVPAPTRVTVTVRGVDGRGPERSAGTSPVRGDITNQFAAVVMDHEGRFAVRVSIVGPLGETTVQATVEATYDLRPPRLLFALYLLPFLVVGGLWGKLLLKRRS